jgi:hypothetical protein
MNTTTNMTTPTTGSSPAAQLLSLLGGQVTGGKTAGAGGHGGTTAGAFAGLLRALANGNGGTPGNAGKTGTQQAAASPGALLAIYNGTTPKNAGQAGDAGANGGNPLDALVAALKAAGIDLGALSLPEGANALTTGNTASGDGQTHDGSDNPLLALVALLAAQMPAQAQPAATSSAGQLPVAAAKATEGGANPQVQFDGQTRQAVADVLASLSPEDRARLADALRQMQAATPDAVARTQAAPSGAAPSGAAPSWIATNTAPQAAIQTDAATPGGRKTADKAPQPATAQAHQGTPAARTDQAAQNPVQGAARIPATAGDGTQADAAARAMTQALPAHLTRDVTVQVTQSHRPTAASGGPQLLAAHTSASVMANGQAQAQAQAQGQAAGIGQQTPQQGIKPTGGGSATSLFELPSADQDTLPDGTDGTLLTGMPGATSQPGSVDQLASSVTAMARAPMTPQAAPAQVAMHMAKAAEAGSNRFVIQLSPAHMGDVRVDMKVNKDGTVHAMLHVEKPETLQMLQRDAGLLHQALQAAGLKPDGGSLNFSLRQDGGQFAGQDGGGHAHGGSARMGEPDASVADMAALSPRRSHAGRLDVTI